MAEEFVVPIFAQEVDRIANTNPQRTYTSIPERDWRRDGWRDITFAQVANGINFVAHWMDHTFGEATGFPTFAYYGPSDLRYPFMLGAAMKTRRKVLFPDVVGLSEEARKALLDKTECKVLICTQEHSDAFRDLAYKRPGTRLEIIPGFEDCMDASDVAPYEFGDPLSSILKDPCLIYHTSGTTGDPKTLTVTYEALQRYQEGHRYRAKPGERLNWENFRDRRLLVSSPFYWAFASAVVTSIVTTAGVIPVLVPTDAPRPVTSSYLEEVQDRAPISAASYSPVILKDFCKSPHALQRLSKLDFVWYSGAPLDKWAGDILSQYVHVISVMGSTEVGGIPNYVNDPEDFQYIRPHEMAGARMEYREEDNLYELVYQKNKDRPQAVFVFYPELVEYRTRDLFERHPQKPGWYRAVGRLDDFVKLSSLDRFYATQVEGELEKSPSIKSALMGGDERSRPFVLVETYETHGSATRNEDTFSKVWEAVEQVNNSSSSRVQIPQELVILTDPTKAFARLGKGTLNRRASIALYKEEIESAYSIFESK